MEHGRDACPVLAARLVIPTTSSRQHISRKRLLCRLDGSLHTALTLVKAPAGFGKTTLVSQWVHSRHLATAWVSLGSSENNPFLFWRYVITGLERLHPSIAEHMAGWSLFSPSQSSELALAALSNALMALNDDLVLVLDNYQHVTDAGIERSLLSLLEYCPLPLHVILLTRQETRLPLARLRLNNKVHELSALDLRFSLAETREVLSLVAPRCTPQESAALYQQTGGWIAGLLLSLPALHQAAEDTRDNSPTALPEDSQRSLHAYLLEEVWTSLPAWIQNFLLQTSILDRFNAQLCDAVIGQSRGQEALAFLAETGLFLTPLQDQEGWYCYAPYIAPLLRSQLQRSDPARVPLLYQRAVAWYEQQRPVEAIKHAQQEQEGEQLARLMTALEIKVYAENPSSLPVGPRGQHEEIVSVEPLSDRERAVLGLVARGYTNAQIAQHLVLTVHTVKTHVRNIYAKMQVHTRVQAVVKANDSGLLEAGEAPESRIVDS
jgi:LuxR family maltose regulon positive regulatory protein